MNRTGDCVSLVRPEGADDGITSPDSIEVHEQLDLVVHDIERWQELGARSVADVRTRVSVQVVGAGSQAVSVEQPGADVSRQAIGSRSRHTRDEQAPVGGCEVEETAGRRRRRARHA